MTTSTVPYGYTYQTQYTSAAGMWKPGAGNGRNVTGITIHHWGDSLNLSFEGIRDYLCSSRPANPTSAHYVVQGADADGTKRPIVACIVDPDDIAYACGNWSANLTQISIECRPNMRDADYAAIAELVARLRDTYNIPRSQLFPHKHWVATACPGAYDLPRIDREAAAWTAAHAGTTAAPKPTTGGTVTAKATTTTLSLTPNPAILGELTGLVADTTPNAAGTHTFEWSGDGGTTWLPFATAATTGRTKVDHRFGGSHPIRVRFTPSNAAAYKASVSPNVPVTSVPLQSVLDRLTALEKPTTPPAA